MHRFRLWTFDPPEFRTQRNRLLPIEGGDGSTLSLDFTTGVLDPRLTFTRASTTSTFINSSGLVATAGTNVARFDHDPTTLLPKGLLIEGSATNLLFYSQDVTQGAKWTIQGSPGSYSSISATGGTAPDNTNTANLCTESIGSNARSIYQSVSSVAGTYTVSVWAKAGTGSARFIRLVLSSAAGDFVYVTVNIANGAVTQSATAVGTASAASATVTQYTGSWYKISLTGTLAAALNFIFIIPTDSGTASVNTADYGRYTYTGDGSSFCIWGAQLETGSGASSYIPTGASTVQRLSDSCSIPVSAFGFVTTGGTFQVNYRRGEFGTQNRGILNTDYVGGRWLGCSSTNASSTALLEWWSGSLGIATQVTGPNKYAYSYGANTGLGVTRQLPVSLSVNGSTTNGTFGNGTTTGNDVPNLANITNVIIGAASQTNPYNTANRDFLNNCVSLVKYWPIRLSDAQLTTLTT